MLLFLRLSRFRVLMPQLAFDSSSFSNCHCVILYVLAVVLSIWSFSVFNARVSWSRTYVFHNSLSRFSFTRSSISVAHVFFSSSICQNSHLIFVFQIYTCNLLLFKRSFISWSLLISLLSKISFSYYPFPSLYRCSFSYHPFSDLHFQMPISKMSHSPFACLYCSQFQFVNIFS